MPFTQDGAPFCKVARGDLPETPSSCTGGYCFSRYRFFNSITASRSSRQHWSLKKKGQRLRADHRGGPCNFFLIDNEKQSIIKLNVDLCDIARKLKVMRPWERLTLE
jgi:hypothetical protein